MRPRILVHVVSALVFFIGVAMLPALLLALFDGSEDVAGIGTAMIGTMLAGALGWIVTRRTGRQEVNHREGFAIVSVGWAMVCVAGAMPYLAYAHMSGTCDRMSQVEADAPEEAGAGWEFCDFTNAAFESTSGFTTTGATILTGGLWESPGERGDGLPRGILLWRALSHWLGGMGILLMAVAVLPLLGVGGMQLMRAEVPGPTTDRLAPRVAETARVLWLVYAGITALETVLLALGGMDLFEAICHAFATMATGGFSTQAKSAEGFGSAYVEWVTSAFMFIAGVNFSLHYLAVQGRFRGYWRDTEFRFYAALIIFFSLVIAGTLLVRSDTSGFDSVHDAVRVAVFQVLSLVTTTGFSSTNFETWLDIAPLLGFAIFALMFVGGCAGSTGGGVKVVRLWLLLRQGLAETRNLIHPHAVTPIRLGERVVDRDILRSVTAFYTLYLTSVGMAATALAFFGIDFLTSLTAAAATIGNIGPGLGSVGPADNYHFMPTPALWICNFCMILGRLELYTVLVLFVPDFWRR